MSDFPLAPADPIPFAVVYEQRKFGGQQVVVVFPNGWGASVIRHAGSYGTELAVLHDIKHTDGWPKYHLCYASGLTYDVIRHIPDQAALTGLLAKIAALPEKGDCTHDRPADWWERADVNPLEEFFDTIDSMSKMAGRS